jgi:hypothetical protein
MISSSFVGLAGRFLLSSSSTHSASPLEQWSEEEEKSITIINEKSRTRRSSGCFFLRRSWKASESWGGEEEM